MLGCCLLKNVIRLRKTCSNGQTETPSLELVTIKEKSLLQVAPGHLLALIERMRTYRTQRQEPNLLQCYAEFILALSPDSLSFS